ncbi:uncharacterized protein [Gossypium hirsutum]|uniref:Retrotransposon gag domain-containing protein n=1 Tax=Gossypium hirsutum TaxID=3635 RepID=A0A1U8KUA0_GOSHI|nr:uncharacterized protein LOC107919327 [Gossypium hirsutum]
MLLKSGRRTSKDPVNITDRQADHSNPHVEPNVSEDSDMVNQTLKQLASPNLAAQPPSITYPALDRPLKLNSGFLNLFPKFNGLPGEDPYRHINEFLITCSTMQPDGIEEEQIKLRAFPFSLQGLAKDWLYYMPPGSFTTWIGLHKAFLEKYFSASRIGSIRKEICGIKQLVGLTPQDRGMIDTASGGALVDKTPEQARNLIANMAQNTQQFGLRRSDLGKRMDEGQSSMMEAQLANVTAMQQPSHQNLSAETKIHAMLEQMMKMMADQKKETDGRFQSLELTVKQLQTRASSTNVNLGNLQAQVNNRLPSQPVANPRDNVSAITLRNGKELRSILKKVQNSNEEGETEADLQPSQAAPKEVGKSRLQQSTASHDATNFEQEMRVPELRAQAGQNDNNQPRSYLPKAPFPQRLRKEKSDNVNVKILETFRKVQVNIPLIDAIKQVPRYAKFLKELCTSKRKLIGNEKISLGENVSAVFQKKLPIKCKDPGMFLIPCKIGDFKLDRAMLDLGASINVMPRSIYDKVQLDMGASDSSVDVPLLLGRPFLKTARTKIDVHKGNLTMEFDVCALDSPKLTRFKPILPNLMVTGKQVPSLISPPKLELKELPKNLKYIYLGENQTLPLIVSNALTEMQESKLLRVLREHKEAFGWTLADIKGLSTTLCTHKIALEPDSVPKRDPQR